MLQNVLSEVDLEIQWIRRETKQNGNEATFQFLAEQFLCHCTLITFASPS